MSRSPLGSWLVIEHKSEANIDGTRYDRTSKALQRFDTYMDAKKRCDRLNAKVERDKVHDAYLRNGWRSRKYTVELRREYVPERVRK